MTPMKKECVITIAGFLFVALCSVVVASCRKGIDSTRIRLQDYESIVAVVDSTETECLLNPFGMKATGGMLVVANNGRDTIFDTFSVPTLEYVRSGGVQGQGPGELLYPDLMRMGVYGDGLLYLPNGEGAAVDVISAASLEVIDNIDYKLPEGWRYTQVIQPLDSNVTLMQQGWMPMQWAITDAQGDVIRNIEIPFPRVLDEIAGNDDVSRMIARSALTTASRVARRFAIVQRAYPLISIYDFDGNCVARLTIEHHLEKLEAYSYCVDSNDESIYVSFNDPAQPDDGTSTLLKIDWDGTLDRIIRIPIPVGAFCVDGMHSKMYFASMPANDYLYRISF